MKNEQSEEQENIEMHSHPLQRKAKNISGFSPESSAKYVHLAGLLACRTLCNCLPVCFIKQ